MVFYVRFRTGRKARRPTEDKLSLAKFTSDFLIESFTLVDNLFINEHLPHCTEKQLKVYLYGLYMCSMPERLNSIDEMCATLDVTEAELLSIYTDFEDAGLVRVVSKNPLEVAYCSLKRAMQPPKKYKLRYCIDLKGESVRYPYILTVARNWANEGVRTVADVERKLNEYEAQTEDMRAVLAALGRKGGAELEEKQMLLKWTRSWGFTLPAVLEAAKSLKGGKTFRKLDSRLDEFYRMSVFTAEDMKDYNARREHLQDLAVRINKTIGVFYESLDHVLEVYTSPWLEKGFSDDALLLIAHYCFLSGTRTLEGMNAAVEKFYSQGLLTVDAINAFIGEQVAQDERIKKIVAATGRERGVTSSDRAFYRTWSAVWGFSDDVIMYAAELCAGRSYPTSAVNRLLSEWKAQGVRTTDDAKRAGTQSAAQDRPRASSSKNFEERDYTDEQIRSVMVNIDELEDDDL